MDLEVIEGNICDAPEQYIAHQCNCVTDHAAGTAKAIFSRFPYADIYRLRSKRHEPSADEQLGNIIIKGDGLGERLVINMMAQFYPGKPKFPEGRKDGKGTREAAFQECLNKIAAIPGLQSIAFPFKIGCNLGGGDWAVYRKMLKEFAIKTGVKVRVYHLPANV